MSSREEKLEKLKELCDLFRTNIKQYKSSKYDEANTRADFIDKFFKFYPFSSKHLVMRETQSVFVLSF